MKALRFEHHWRPAAEAAAAQPESGELRALPLHRTGDTLRRVADVTVAVLGLLVCAPLMALIAVAIKLDSDGPVFYAQARVGENRRRVQSPMRWLANVIRLDHRRANQHGQIFRMVKFRTMRTDAEASSGAVWAQENDPRVTRVGRFLRKSRLDEIPQLWNVLCGDMSLVGPRPERPEFVRQFVVAIPGYADRHWVKPGITGLSQVRQGYDRNLDDVRRKLDNDLEYIARRSPWLDLQICWRTLSVMIYGRGAR